MAVTFGVIGTVVAALVGLVVWYQKREVVRDYQDLQKELGRLSAVVKEKGDEQDRMMSEFNAQYKVLDGKLEDCKERIYVLEGSLQAARDTLDLTVQFITTGRHVPPTQGKGGEDDPNGE